MSGRILLDTHLLLWALSTPARLPAATRREIDRNQVFVSAASIWEIAIKSSIGKLKADAAEVLDELPVAGFDLLPVSGAHAAYTAGLGGLHKDPFDRMLVAQALCEAMPLLTNDETLAGYGAIVRLI